jgi:hypothetical protein
MVPAGFSCATDFSPADIATVASQQCDSNGRKRLTASKLRLKLGGCPDITEPMPAKPRLTRRRTYQRIRMKFNPSKKVKTTRFKQHLNSKLFAYHLGYLRCC